MKFLLAPDSFKGTLSSSDIIERLERSARKYFSECQFVKIPIADGGEGTADSLIAACGGYKIWKEVYGPEGDLVSAYYGVINGDTAVIEMAQASGLTLLKRPKNPLFASSFGTGELIKDASERGFKKILVAIGGSATNDGGTGALSALGVKFYDAENKLIERCGGASLKYISHIDASALDALRSNAEIRVMCDVTNPLTGTSGATYIYGPQKGATGDILKELEEGMHNYAGVVKEYFPSADDGMPGAGAAGGMGFALTSFLNASLVKGIDAVLDLTGFESLVKTCDLVVTGEGNMDRQSSFGKVPVGVAERAKKFGVPAIAIAGGIMDGAEEVFEHGISGIMPVVCRPMELNEALNNAGEMFDRAADRMFGLLSAGRKLGV